jgi:hypothetical protein
VQAARPARRCVRQPGRRMQPPGMRRQPHLRLGAQFPVLSACRCTLRVPPRIVLATNLTQSGLQTTAGVCCPTLNCDSCPAGFVHNVDGFGCTTCECVPEPCPGLLSETNPVCDLSEPTCDSGYACTPIMGAVGSSAFGACCRSEPMTTADPSCEVSGCASADETCVRCRANISSPFEHGTCQPFIKVGGECNTDDSLCTGKSCGMFLQCISPVTSLYKPGGALKSICCANTICGDCPAGTERGADSYGCPNCECIPLPCGGNFDGISFCNTTNGPLCGDSRFCVAAPSATDGSGVCCSTTPAPSTTTVTTTATSPSTTTALACSVDEEGSCPADFFCTACSGEGVCEPRPPKGAPCTVTGCGAAPCALGTTCVHPARSPYSPPYAFHTICCPDVTCSACPPGFMHGADSDRCPTCECVRAPCGDSSLLASDTVFCDADTDCESGFCETNPDYTAVSGVCCATAPVIGQECSSTHECTSSQFCQMCDGKGTCQRRQRTGEECSTTDTCTGAPCLAGHTCMTPLPQLFTPPQPQDAPSVCCLAPTCASECAEGFVRDISPRGCPRCNCVPHPCGANTNVTITPCTDDTQCRAGESCVAKPGDSADAICCPLDIISPPPTSTDTPSPTTTTTTPSQPVEDETKSAASASQNTNVVIAAGVGACVGVIIVAIAAVLITRYAKRKRLTRVYASDANAPAVSTVKQGSRPSSAWSQESVDSNASLSSQSSSSRIIHVKPYSAEA